MQENNNKSQRLNFHCFYQFYTLSVLYSVRWDLIACSGLCIFCFLFSIMAALCCSHSFSVRSPLKGPFDLDFVFCWTLLLSLSNTSKNPNKQTNKKTLNLIVLKIAYLVWNHCLQYCLLGILFNLNENICCTDVKLMQVSLITNYNVLE